MIKEGKGRKKSVLFHVCLSPVLRRQVAGEKSETPSVRTANESVTKMMTSPGAGGQVGFLGLIMYHKLYYSPVKVDRERLQNHSPEARFAETGHVTA